MNVGELMRIFQDAISSGILNPEDEVKVYNATSGDLIDITEIEPDHTSSDFLIVIKE